MSLTPAELSALYPELESYAKKRVRKNPHTRAKQCANCLRYGRTAQFTYRSNRGDYCLFCIKKLLHRYDKAETITK